MTRNKIIFLFVACTLIFNSCYDEKMEWGRPAGQGDISADEIPLDLAEKISVYDFIKAYAMQYTPNMTIGLGLGADIYIDDAEYQKVANDNFQMFTTGNAMKHASVVGNSGALNFTTIDKFIAAVPSDIKIYGHNFLWHTQQRQAYLKSLIAPKQIVESTGGIANILTGDASDFNGGELGGWSSWGGNKADAKVEAGIGPDGSASMVLSNNGDGNAWEAQFAYTFDDFLQEGKVYAIKFKAKSTVAAGHLQFQYQNGTTNGSQGAYNDFSVGTDWDDFEYEFTVTHSDVNRIILNFGKVGGTYYIDDILFGLKVEDTMDNVLAGDNSTFEGGTTGEWGSWGSNKELVSAEEGVGHNGTYAAVLTNKGDGDAWEAQFAYTFDGYLKKDGVYQIQFQAKSTSDAGQLQFQYQNGTSYGSQGAYNTFNVGTEWVECKHEFTVGFEDVDRIILNFGAVGGTYYIDNIKFGEKKEAAAKSNRTRAQKAGGVHYEIKTPEEKKTALLGAMENWIKGMSEHVGDRITEWDVINEPIDDNSKWRGIDGNFMGGDEPDSEPVETEETGLNLNWGDGHFYWGYYIGKEYATKAFEYARKYTASGSKLYVNDYNLETNPTKLNSLIEFVKYIDENNETGAPIVDGIGTQMHLNIESISREQIDEMFITMANTGKLVRVTELDVCMGTKTPTVDQLAKQAEVYQWVAESYVKNIPEAQQSGITIWTLTDHKREHTYWLPDDLPNLFDANYGRKHAYKGFCDGLAGFDIGENFNSGNLNRTGE